MVERSFPYAREISARRQLGRQLVSRVFAVHVLLSMPVAALAQSALPTVAELSAQTAKRFPQPVRVGAIVGQDLLEPVESQHVLGRVESVEQGPDGGVLIVVAWGGVLGMGTRHIALPAEAVAYLGPQVALIGYTPDQAASLPPAPSLPALPPDATIKLGVVRPFH